MTTPPTPFTQPLREAFAAIGAAPKVWGVFGALALVSMGHSLAIVGLLSFDINVIAAVIPFEILTMLLVGVMVVILYKHTPSNAEMWAWIGIVLLATLVHYAWMMLGQGLSLLETQNNASSDWTPARWIVNSIAMVVIMAGYLWAMARLCGANIGLGRFISLLRQVPIYALINAVWWIVSPEILQQLGYMLQSAFLADSDVPFLAWYGLWALIWLFTAALGVVTVRAMTICDADAQHAKVVFR